MNPRSAIGEVPRRGSVPRTYVIGTGIEVALAVLAIALDLWGSCRACLVGVAGHAHLAIGFLGAAGYLALLFTGWMGRERVFYGGLMAAAGIHASLGLWMATSGLFCLPCLGSLAIALGLAVHGVAMRRIPWRLAERVTFPALIVSSVGIFILLTQEGRRAAVRNRERVSLHSMMRAARPAEVLPSSARSRARAITVFEMPECPYCLEFRRDYWPRLKSEFGPRIEVSFVDARESGWVRRTPTIVVEDGPTWEGLPLAYADLAEGVSRALESGTQVGASPGSR